jgi:predicted ATP-dependent protease
MAIVKALKPGALARHCNASQFAFETTAELEDLIEMIGQPRASAAVRFGVDIEQEGYNVFALGPSGTGKQSLVRQFLQQQATARPAPPDWCYVNNFDQPHKPLALALPAGRGNELRREVDQLVQGLQQALLAHFEGEEYQHQVQTIEEHFHAQHTQALSDLQHQTEAEGLTLLSTPAGLTIVPVRDGEVLSPDLFEQLPEEQRKTFLAAIARFQNELHKISHQIPRWEREQQEALDQLMRDLTGQIVDRLLEGLRQHYQDLPNVVAYFEKLRQDVVEHVEDFLSPAEEGESEAVGVALPHSFLGAAILRRYRINVLIDHSNPQGAPVIYEDNPTYQNLIGRVEYLSEEGILLTDFNLIKPGALHRANGGFLMLEAQRVFSQPFAWEGLKRALQSGQIRIESVSQFVSLVSTISLEPEPVPLRVKVVLLGEPWLYSLLCELDPDFRELFKVPADFDDQMVRTADSEQLYARLLATLVHKKGLRPFDRSAIARIIDQSARLTGDAERLSMQMGTIVDLLYEADYWAAQQAQQVVTATAVEQALTAQRYRADRVPTRLEEETLRGTLAIETAGAQVGQINGLSVFQWGTLTFGRPTRITATIRLGEGKVVDIEREVELGGPIHSKGVLILSGFLGSRYTADQPLSLSASLVFEQSYGGIEGDSASLAELCALLSAIARVPLKQGLAVTGSVNQHGEVQAVGGINEKIEGFWALCQARGLTGAQGVLLPAPNTKHLMLRQELVESVAAGQFHLYAVETVDQALELLTGLPAGERDHQGDYPEGSLNDLIETRLTDLAERWQATRSPLLPAAATSQFVPVPAD